ncbi:NAD(P)H-hydrate dehydratase [Idiomarina sp. HP20-50]|uniref:NAD(P)H-hydrate dehydratase n=1 Tax=Idiomarina sp. HP20-50 TaxID=3070813 RepID=UPI00294AAB5D|nr:NAD(P)H-hydrate dehydratase [Idiomarina sp. HP20-50]MDV6317287.1 NAD(P)H-hydrate dehydratase [Idiomarina sp. HP20-50]
MANTDSNHFTNCLYRVEQLQQGEQKAAESCAMTMMQLMSAAGKAVFNQLKTHFPAPARIAVCCGEGNNGGDGYIVARLAQEAGYQVQVFALKPNADLPQSSDSDAHKARNAWREQGGSEKALLDCSPEQFDLVVDALFGVGLNRALEGDPVSWVQRVNASTTPVLSIDVPSGLNADNGHVPGAAVRARITVSLVAFKRGLFTGKAQDHTGDLFLEDLGIGRTFQQQNEADWFRVEAGRVESWLPARTRCTHKGEQGHVLIVGGQPGMSGAVILAMKSALRAGAGKVSVACHPDVQAIVAAAQPEAMVHAIHGEETLQSLLGQASAVALGPGLGQSRWSHDVFTQVMKADVLKVIDADGLNLLASYPTQSPKLLLTPHPGEAARLLQTTTDVIESDRFAATVKLREKYGAQVLLKGAGSLLVTDRGRCVIDRGSPAMASGGMGDLLTGVVTALLAQRMATAQALIAGAFWHAVAGEMAGKNGERGTLASDLLPYIRRLVNGYGRDDD